MLLSENVSDAVSSMAGMGLQNKTRAGLWPSTREVNLQEGLWFYMATCVDPILVCECKAIFPYGDKEPVTC